MATPRRKCRLADIDFRDEDLRKYKKVIIDTINKTVPNKNPRVFADYYLNNEGQTTSLLQPLDINNDELSN